MANHETLPSNVPLAELVARADWQTAVADSAGIDETPGANIFPPITLADGMNELADKGGEQHILLMNAWDEMPPRLHRKIERIEAGHETEDKNFQAGVQESFPFPPSAHATLSNRAVRRHIANRRLLHEHLQLAKAWPEALETYSEGIEHGIALGYVPPDVAERLADLQKTSVLVMDAALFRAHNKTDTTAVYQKSSDQIIVRHDVDDAYKDNLAHEFTHKIAGGTFVKHVAADNYGRRRVGFNNASSQKGGPLDEALAEHIALGALTGDFATIDPGERGDSGAYYCERKLLASFIGQSSSVIDLKVATRAFFEDTEDGSNVSARKTFVAQTVRAYGTGALRKFDELCRMIGSLPDDDIGELMSRIHTPEFNAVGDVVRTGFIDTSPLPTEQLGPKVHVRSGPNPFLNEQS